MSTDIDRAPSFADLSTTKGKAMLALRILLALAVLAGAAYKLSAAGPSVQEFDQVGLGQGFRYLTGLLEIAGAILLLVPGRIFYGAALLAIVCAGAFFAQLLKLHGDVVHAIVLTAVFAAIAYAYRWQVGAKARR